jgi:hypothetical protein
VRLAGLLALCAIRGWAEHSPYIGAPACGRCHPAQFRLQSSTGHARSLFPAAQHPLVKTLAPKTPLRRKPDYEFRYALEKRGFLVRISGAEGAIVLPLEWAFGSGDVAVTFVSRLGPSSYIEHYFSYYPASAAMGITPGQEAIGAASPLDAAGFVHRDLDAAACFQCHSTGPVDISGGDFQPNERGVNCEACHGPGEEHRRTGGKVSLRNPGHLSPIELNDVCGRCHRLPPSAGSRFDWDNPWNVRFEPVYLSQSACFKKSGGKLSCLSCHAPHEVLRKNDPAFYNGVCSGCHPAAHPESDKTDCIACHMPRVSPRPPLWFTNHWIGGYGSAKLKPSLKSGN